MSTEPQQEFVPCCHHPETPATQNCMGCGNPLCMECVRANGYYCSETCKQSVRATEPDAVSETEAGYTEVDQRVEQTMAAAGSFVGKLKWPVIVLVIGIVAVWVYRNYFGPEGEVVATMEFASLDEQFSAHDAGGGQ
ncbi:MAG: hypothetical protein GTO53_13990, partial [Planctomycetales bacterium]|nr:hypothetical protein [Planctomycetales bacterium]